MFVTAVVFHRERSPLKDSAQTNKPSMFEIVLVSAASTWEQAGVLPEVHESINCTRSSLVRDSAHVHSASATTSARRVEWRCKPEYFVRGLPAPCHLGIKVHTVTTTSGERMASVLQKIRAKTSSS